MSLASTFADFFSELDELPCDVRKKALTCVLNNAGLGRAVVDDPLNRKADAAAALVFGEGDRSATRLFSGEKGSLGAAAFANGAVMGAMGRADTLGTIHVGQVVTPVVLAIAEAEGISSDLFLKAIVAGYEVGGRLDRAVGEAGAGSGFRSTAVNGAVAAAASAGVAMQLGKAELASALSMAASMTGGTLQTFIDGSDEPHLQAGWAAQLGVMAAAAARTGLVGARQALEGNAGILRGVARSQEDYSGLFDDFGSKWFILETTFKPFPVCAFAQTACYLGLDLRGQIEPGGVAEMTIRLNPREAAYPGLDFAGPFETTLETAMSALFAVAHGIVHGEPVRMRSLSLFDDAEMSDLLAKMKLVGDPQVPALSAVADITLSDGSRLSQERKMSAADYAFGMEEVVEMVRRALSEGVDPEQAVLVFERMAQSATQNDALEVNDLLALFERNRD